VVRNSSAVVVVLHSILPAAAHCRSILVVGRTGYCMVGVDHTCSGLEQGRKSAVVASQDHSMGRHHGERVLDRTVADRLC
jgi:hypothetical protein